MDKLRVVDTNLGMGIANSCTLSKMQKQDLDTLTIVNQDKTAELKSKQVYQNFLKWLDDNGAKFPNVDYPVAFGRNGELIGLCAKEDIPPWKSFLFIPQKLIINAIVCQRDPVCGPLYLKHPEIFKTHSDAEYLTMIIFVMHHMMIGEKSFWHPFWSVINLSDMPMRWDLDEVSELQDAFLEREVHNFRDEYDKEFELVFETFRENKYEECWPGIMDDSKPLETLKAEFEELFYTCFNTIVTRCFGWGLPKTSLIPFADCINHHNVDSTYEFICEELHKPLHELNDNQKNYFIELDEFMEDNSKTLNIEPDDNQDDASYYTKSKMMINISDFNCPRDEEGKYDLKLNDNMFKEDMFKITEEMSSSQIQQIMHQKGVLEKVKAYPKTEEMKQQCLTNRSLFTVKKYMMREDSMATTPEQLYAANKESIRIRDVWDFDYRSSSDEEDNDSEDEENYGKLTQYPKCDQQTSEIQTKQETEASSQVKKKTEKEKKPTEDVIMKLIEKDRALTRRDLQARLERVKRQQLVLKKFRKLADISLDELCHFDDTEDYSWWKGVDDDRGVYFAMGAKFSSYYKKGDQLFNCYGRRTNRFLLVNYGFCIRNNKYNSLGFKVFVNAPAEESKDGEEKAAQKYQKVVRMKLNRFSLDLLQYLRANLVFSFQFKSEENKNLVNVSTPVETDFEIYCLDQAMQLIQSMIDSKYATTLKDDLQILEIMAEGSTYEPKDEKETEIQNMIKNKPNGWRYKLSLIHRVNQKEILHSQLKFYKILHSIISRAKDCMAKNQETTALDFKKIYLEPIQEQGEENTYTMMRNRVTLRNYLLEYAQSQQRYFGHFKYPY